MNGVWACSSGLLHGVAVIQGWTGLWWSEVLRSDHGDIGYADNAHLAMDDMEDLFEHSVRQSCVCDADDSDHSGGSSNLSFR